MKIDEMVLKLCYLFLAADNDITEKRMAKFDEVGNGYPNFAAERQMIIADCEQYILKSLDNNNRYTVIMDGINEVTRCDSDTVLSYSPLSNSFGQKECIWLLVCMAWYDGYCSENNKKIIYNLSHKWKIDKSVLLEMEDTAVTLCEIDKYRIWVKTINDPYDSVTALIQELDKNQQELAENIFETIGDFDRAN